MMWAWIGWVLVAVALEIWTVSTSQMTFSQFVDMLTTAFPPLPWLACIAVGSLAAHFWWPCK